MTTDPVSPTTGASTPMGHLSPGGLPIRPRNYLPTTKLVKDIGVLLQMTLHTGACSLIGGPIGIGKTTAVVEVARDLNCSPVYINMFGTTNTRDQMQTIWRAMTGTNASGSAHDIRDQILQTLTRKTMTLLIDDAHHVGFNALASILSIHNRFHAARGKGTPIVLCGNNLERHLLQTLPELLSRASVSREFSPLTGKALVDLVLAMEPRIAGTDPATIRAIDNQNFRGDMRRWRQFFELLALTRTTADPQPLTDDEIQQVLSFVPRGTR